MADDDAPEHRSLRGPWVAFDAAAWLRITERLTLEQEGALARILAAMVLRDGLFPADLDVARHLLRTTPRAARRILDSLVASGVLQRSFGEFSFAFATAALADRTQLVSRQRENARKKRRSEPENVSKNSDADPATASIALTHTHRKNTERGARRDWAPAPSVGDALSAALARGAAMRKNR